MRKESNTMLSGQTILFISDVDWDGHWVCEQQIANLLSERNTVIYVEQIRTALAFLYASGGDTTPVGKLRLIRKGLRRQGKNLHIISPPFVLPFRYLPLIDQINQWIVGQWLKRLLKRNTLDVSILITFDPASSGIIGKFREKVLIYYRNDDHDKRGLWFNPDRLVSKREAELIKNVDIVCALSEGLAEKSKRLGMETFVVPNGVDIELFLHATKSIKPEPVDIARIPHPRIGVVGILDWRIDVDLLEKLARKHSTWSIVLVGPVSSRNLGIYETLRTLPNVFFLGAKEVTEVPDYMKALDVGMIPYIINNYTKAILSLKVFEYSALGIPTVATAMPQLFRYSDVIDIAGNPDEFEACILSRLANHLQITTQLVDFAKQNTWRNRAEQLSQIVECLSTSCKHEHGI